MKLKVFLSSLSIWGLFKSEFGQKCMGWSFSCFEFVCSSSSSSSLSLTSPSWSSFSSFLCVKVRLRSFFFFLFFFYFRTSSLHYLLLTESEGRTVSYRKYKVQLCVTDSTDTENDVREMFIISLENWIKLKSTPRGQAVRGLENGRLN